RQDCRRIPLCGNRPEDGDRRDRDHVARRVVSVALFGSILAIVNTAINLVDSLALELERPRQLSSRVLNYILQTYGIEQDGLATFLAERVPDLEDDEIDLMFSSVFTPKLADQAIFAELLGRRSVPREQWPLAAVELVARPTQAHLSDDVREYVVILREV